MEVYHTFMNIKEMKSCINKILTGNAKVFVLSRMFIKDQAALISCFPLMFGCFKYSCAARVRVLDGLMLLVLLLVSIGRVALF